MLKAGERLGPWTLREQLGGGGNAEVWLAEHIEDNRAVALKVLKTRKQESEPFRRFRAEVELNRRLTDRAGTLPLIDASLPDSTEARTYAWIAFPMAKPIRSALGPKPELRAVVEAVAHIGDVLADLKSDGIAHRDLKPDNLFQLDDGWVVGDFGIASYPGKEALTQPGKSLGPRFFIADEMIQRPREANAHAADVYSLAKTLWVLATENTYPPQGHQRRDTGTNLLRAYFREARAHYLDQLIEQATSPNVEERPTVESFVAELRAWLAPPAVPLQASPPLEDIAERLAILLIPSERQAQREQEQLRAANALFQSLTAGLIEVKSRIEHLPHVFVDYAELPLSLGDAANSPPGREIGSSCVVTSTHSKTGTALYSGFRLHLERSEATVRAKHLVIAVRCSYNTPWEAQWNFRLGSALEAHCLVEMPHLLLQHLEEALNFMAHEIEWYEEHRWWE